MTEATRPPADGEGRVVARDVVFAERTGFRPLALDLHLPRREGAPVVLYVHGGGWRLGSRRTFAPGTTAQESFGRITDAGFAVASVDYRLSGEARFPAQLEDVSAALDWLRRDGASYGVDASRVVAWGESAGAQLAALLGLSSSAAVAGVVDWYGPADLLTLGAHLDPQRPDVFDAATDSREAGLLGGSIRDLPALARGASPALQVHAGAPPFLIMHGSDDQLVPCAQSEELAAALTAAGVDVELVRVPGADHFWRGVTDKAPLFGRALAFAERLTG